jgi:hypothetical protein
MNFISELPPYHFLITVLEHCPRAARTYVYLWQQQDSANNLHILKKSIKEKYLTTIAKFRHDLLMLVREGLISISEDREHLHIEVVDWDDVA